jgi:hypothetical protein
MRGVDLIDRGMAVFQKARRKLVKGIDEAYKEIEVNNSFISEVQEDNDTLVSAIERATKVIKNIEKLIESE